MDVREVYDIDDVLNKVDKKKNRLISVTGKCTDVNRVKRNRNAGVRII